MVTLRGGGGYEKDEVRDWKRDDGKGERETEREGIDRKESGGGYGK